MATQTPDVAEPIKGEHIFAATKVTALAKRWRGYVAAGKAQEAHQLLEELTVDITALLERLAQFEGFHRSVPLPALVSAAQEKLPRWLIKWKPRKGKLFTFLSKCAKNSFKTEVNKQKSFTRRHHVTGDNLEKLFGAEDPNTKYAEETRERVNTITARWADAQELGAICYMIECLIDEEVEQPNKDCIIRSATYSYGLSPDLCRFFYTWSLIAMRDAFYEKTRVPFTEQDLLRHAHSYTHLVDLLNYITFAQLKQIIACMGGVRVKFPTITQMAKLHENYRMTCELENSDTDPDSFEEIGTRYNKSGKTAEQIYHETLELIDKNRSAETFVFDDHSN